MLLIRADPESSQPATGGEPLLEPLKPRTVKPIAVSRPATKASGLGWMLAPRRDPARNAAQPQVKCQSRAPGS